MIATAGHVDHGKSSLVQRLTGMDPDRFEEEKRRGLTIDLGFAWMTLASGAEIGFVDVPGHERFVRNMLAGIGPVHLVLFVVAADEGWKPQSEEHLAIADILGVDGAVVAITKRDLVDPETLAATTASISERLDGTAFAAAPLVACSSRTGEGLEELLAAMDAMVRAAPSAAALSRPRQFVDRVFTIKGAGTVLTGTLTGGSISTGDEIELYPDGLKARVRGLQSHKRSIQTASPVSRVALNVAATDRTEVKRGNVVGKPGQWRPTSVFETRIRPIRGLDHPLTSRGAFKLYAGSAERDAKIRLYPDGSFARIRVSEPLVLDVFDRFVLREAGRHETVAGGVVLDIHPPLRPGARPAERLVAREKSARDELPSLLLKERGAVNSTEIFALTGSRTHPDAIAIGDWWISEPLHAELTNTLSRYLSEFHASNPLREGADLSAVRTIVSDRLARERVTTDPGLVEAFLDILSTGGLIARTGSTVRLETHRVSAAGPELDNLIAAVSENEAAPPTVAELASRGVTRDLVDAAVKSGVLVRVSRDLVFGAGFVARADRLLREGGWSGGITVSAFRESLGTSRKYALPLLEYFDSKGVTVRKGDVRLLRTQKG